MNPFVNSVIANENATPMRDYALNRFIPRLRCYHFFLSHSLELTFRFQFQPFEYNQVFRCCLWQQKKSESAKPRKDQNIGKNVCKPYRPIAFSNFNERFIATKRHQEKDDKPLGVKPEFH